MYVETVCARISMDFVLDIVNPSVMSMGAQISLQGPVSVSWTLFRSGLLDHSIILYLVLGWGCSIKSSIIIVPFFFQFYEEGTRGPVALHSHHSLFLKSPLPSLHC